MQVGRYAIVLYTWVDRYRSVVIVYYCIRSLASEWSRYGMRFNVIAPGPIETKVSNHSSQEVALQL